MPSKLALGFPFLLYATHNAKKSIIMLYNILEFHIPNTYVRVTIHLGSKRNVVIRPNSYVKIYGLERTIKILHVITRLSPALTYIC